MTAFSPFYKAFVKQAHRRKWQTRQDIMAGGGKRRVKARLRELCPPQPYLPHHRHTTLQRAHPPCHLSICFCLAKTLPPALVPCLSTPAFRVRRSLESPTSGPPTRPTHMAKQGPICPEASPHPQPPRPSDLCHSTPIIPHTHSLEPLGKEKKGS